MRRILSIAIAAAALAACSTPDPRVQLLDRRLAPESIRQAEDISRMTQDEVLAELAR